MYLKINDTVFTIEEQEAYTILELLRNVVIPQIETNAENIKTLNDGIEQIESELTGIQNKIVQIQTDVATNTSNITTLQDDVNHIISVDIVDINNEISGLKTQDDNLSRSIEGVQAKANSNEKKINDINNTTIPGIMEEIANTQSTLSDVQSNVGQLEISITNVENQADQLVDDKFDDATITNTNVLNLIANNVIKKSLTLPTGGGGETGDTIEHIQLLTDDNNPVTAFMLKNTDYALIFICDICNFLSTDHFTLPQNLQNNYLLSTGNYTNGEGKVSQAGQFKEIYIVVDNNDRSQIKLMGSGAMPVQIGANGFIWAWFILKLTEG